MRLRRELHAHPELSTREQETAARLEALLRPVYPDLRTGVAGHGLTALLPAARGAGALPRRTILFRADMDGLPIQERNEVSYASRNPGAMHACGHDGHMAILVETARIAAAERERIRVGVRFVFQPAEESPGGALPMIRAGVLDDPRIEAAFGLHLWTPLPVGKIAVTSGPMMASADEFELVVHGKGGHGALPHDAVDAVVVGSQIVTALQTVVSRNVDPTQTAVLSIGTFHAGDAFNVLAETAQMRGTIRSFKGDVREVLVRRLREVSEGVAEALGARCEFRFHEHYPPLVNDPRMADFVADVAAGVVGEENVIRDLTCMGAEDMSYFLREAPGAFFFVGAGNPERGIASPHHSPHFDIDEDSLGIGVEMFLSIAERYLESFESFPG